MLHKEKSQTREVKRGLQHRAWHCTPPASCSLLMHWTSVFGFFPSPILFTFGSSLQGAVQPSSSNTLLLAAASNLLNLKPEKHVVGWDTRIGIKSPVLTASSRRRICIRPLSAVSLLSIFHDHFPDGCQEFGWKPASGVCCVKSKAIHDGTLIKEVLTFLALQNIGCSNS